MNIKVQCSCDTRYSFEVEPVNGKMPANIFCPKCGADGTDYANQIIQQNLGETPETADVPVSKPRIRLHVAATHAAPPPVLAVAGESGAVAHAAVEMCHRHPRSAATEHCVVCQKPICPECMQTFGYLCSVSCRYRAEQEKIRVPVYKLQRNLVERGTVRKSVGISVAVGLVVVALFGALFWYTMSGSKPRSYYTLKLPPEKGGTYSQFLGPNQILLLNKNKISVHSIKTKKEAWSTVLDDPKTEAATASTKVAGKKPVVDEDESYGYEDYSSGPAPHFSGNDIWICLSHRAVCVDLTSGTIKHNVPFKGRRVSFTPGESTLLVVSESGPTKKIVTQISLASGETKTSEVTVAAREKVGLSKDLPSTILPTAGLLMKYELDAAKVNQPSIYKSSSEFFSAGQNLVEMRVKLVEAKLTTVQTMKKPGASKLDSGTSASTSTRAVAEEIFNELKRADTGGFRQVDESRYGVTLHREMEKGAIDWTGEVHGVPIFFPLKTVDLLTAGKSLLIFDKQNKKIAQAELTFPIADHFTTEYHGNDAPCVEANGTLFFFDKGVLTAFDLQTGSARWRLPSVGISGIHLDKKGFLYVGTTTAAPEDIQYSEQIKMSDAITPLVMKVEAVSGKILWKSAQTCDEVFLTGKYVYVTDSSRKGFSMITAAQDAFGQSSKGGGLRLYRIDPSNGKKMWSFSKQGQPENVDFSENRILLHYSNEIEIMKFISF